MNEIRCPKCNEVFVVDETGYADIVKQIRDKEFEKALHEREQLLEESKENAVKLAEANTEKTLQKDILEKERKITELQAQLKNQNTEKRLSISEAVKDIEKERDNLANELKSQEMKMQLFESTLKSQHQDALKHKDEIIDYYKDMKAKLSTKMLGETLEQHCEIQFNQIRATAFPNAYFEKDNDVKTGSKGDYIYREHDSEGNEIISIMFEMKNEGDETTTKKKNEDFLKELDKDRNEKNCEYAVLVTLLEADNELYNSGIVDASHKYPKMYIVRPQFFIPMITVLRNAALNSLKYKSELALIRNQNIDITHFEENLETFKSGFAHNYKLASKKFETAINEIDKTIERLQKTKEALQASDKYLRIANDKAEDITIKKLTRNSPTMAEKFEELKEAPLKEIPTGETFEE